VTVGPADEAIAFAGDGLDEAGLLGIIAQGLANLANCGIDSVFGVDEDLFAPEALDDLLAGGDAAFFFGEQDQQFHRDALDFLDATVAPQFEAGGIELKVAEVVDTGRHNTSPRSPKTIPLMPAVCIELPASAMTYEFTPSSPNLYRPCIVRAGRLRQDAARTLPENSKEKDLK
jgi:hypothetical protein